MGWGVCLFDWKIEDEDWNEVICYYEFYLYKGSSFGCFYWVFFFFMISFLKEFCFEKYGFGE